MILYLLAPIAAEILTGSTPLRVFLSPPGFIFQTGYYGACVLLLRDVVRRRRLGWASILWLGTAFGIVEAGLVNLTWYPPFDSHRPDSLAAGYLLGIDWTVVLWVTPFLAIVAVVVPIVLADSIFPSVASIHWLSRPTSTAFAVLWGIDAGLVALGIGWHRHLAGAHSHVPLKVALPIVFVAISIWIGLRARFARPVVSLQRVPGLWTLRLLAFVVALIFWSTYWILPPIIRFAPLRLLMMAVLIGSAWWCLRRWSRRSGWGAAHRLALVSGTTAFLALCWAPLLEFVVHSRGHPYAGVTVVGLLWIAGLCWLELRVNRAVRPPGSAARAAR